MGAPDGLPPLACDGTDVTIAIVNTVTNLGCGQTLTATRTWRATDACGNASMCSQMVQLTAAPLTAQCPPNRMVPCDSTWTFDVPVITGGCNATVQLVDTATNRLCGATYTATRTWTITDGCNTNTCVQIIEVKDQVPPVIVCLPDITVTNMSEVPHCPKTLTEYLLGGGQAQDACSPVHYRCLDSSIMTGPCGGVIERMHMVFDDCMNTNFCIQKITVITKTEVAINIQAADTNLDICMGGTLTFCVAASGNGPFFYNWLLDGLNINGANGPCLTITNLNPIDVGRYSVQVISQCETVTRTLALPGCGAPQPLMMGIQVVPAGVQLRFRGQPGHAYQILRGSDLETPWTLIGIASAGADGLGQFLDTSSDHGEVRMYKLLTPAIP